jgi:FMN phosphatase YigB (HAD superfamily)
MDERRDIEIPLDVRPPHLMPGAAAVLSLLRPPLFLWANTRVAGETAVRHWLKRAGLASTFQCVVTSIEAGARKPAPEFFQYALGRCGVNKEDVLFVGNQLNTDVAGAQAFGIATVWLSGASYRSLDDAPCDVTPTYAIETLTELPAFLHRLGDP